MKDDLVAYLLERAHGRGLRDCLLYHLSAVESRADETGREEHSETSGLAFEATCDGRNASAYTEAFTEEAADFLVESCAQNAAIGGGSSRPLCPAGLRYPTLPGSDPRAEEAETCRELLGELREALGSCGAEFERSVAYAQSAARGVRILNDRGVDVSHRGSRFSVVLSPVYTRGTVMKNGLYFRGAARPGELDLRALVASAAAEVRAYEGASRLPTGRYDVVFRNEVATYLLQALAIFFSEDFARAGRSRFRGRLGARVASELLTISDEPHLPGGLFSTPFDAQGVPTARKVLLERGRLADMLCDLAGAQAAPGLTAGNAARLDHYHPPEVSPSNLAIEPGEEPLQALLERLGKGLYVADITAYFHGAGVNPVTGDFAVPAKGFVVEGGKRGRPFDNVVLAGNLYDLLLGIEGVASDAVVGLPTSFIPGAPARSGAYRSPALLARGIAVSGD